MNMNEIKDYMLENKNWVVYGATPDKEKFGYKIPVRMKNHGYNIFGINSKYKGENIENINIYESLDEIKESIDCIDVVVNPRISLNVIDEAVKKGIKYLWFQPGTWNDEVLQKAKDNDLNIVYGHCVYAILGAEGK